MKNASTAASAAAVNATPTAKGARASSRDGERAKARVRRASSITTAWIPEAIGSEAAASVLSRAYVRVQVSERPPLRSVQADRRSTSDSVCRLRRLAGRDGALSGPCALPRLGLLLDGLRPRQTEERRKGRNAGVDSVREEGQASGEKGRRGLAAS